MMKEETVAEFSNPAQLLKLRLDRWIKNNKEKKNLIDMYTRNVKILIDAFDQIKEATGISSTEEIVTTFIKAEEQNSSLMNYVSMLTSEIDVISDQNDNIEAEIKRNEELRAMKQSEKVELKEKTGREIDEMKESVNKQQE